MSNFNIDSYVKGIVEEYGKLRNRVAQLERMIRKVREINKYEVEIYGNLRDYNRAIGNEEWANRHEGHRFMSEICSGYLDYIYRGEEGHIDRLLSIYKGGKANEQA